MFTVLQGCSPKTNRVISSIVKYTEKMGPGKSVHYKGVFTNQGVHCERFHCTLTEYNKYIIVSVEILSRASHWQPTGPRCRCRPGLRAPRGATGSSSGCIVRREARRSPALGGRLVSQARKPRPSSGRSSRLHQIDTDSYTACLTRSRIGPHLDMASIILVAKSELPVNWDSTASVTAAKLDFIISASCCGRLTMAFRTFSCNCRPSIPPSWPFVFVAGEGGFLFPRFVFLPARFPAILVYMC